MATCKARHAIYISFHMSEIRTREEEKTFDQLLNSMTSINEYFNEREQLRMLEKCEQDQIYISRD